jgi:hypothetical protein
MNMIVIKRMYTKIIGSKENWGVCQHAGYPLATAKSLLYS